MFDLIVPIYFEYHLTFASFLLWMAKKLGLQTAKFEQTEINERREFVMNSLGLYKHALLFVDNYETISGSLMNDNSPSDDAIKINSFLENVPPNTTILLTSRQRNNLDGERPVRLDGLNETEGRDLFIELSKNHFTVKPSTEMIEALEEISKKAGGHPLSIEILARRYRGEGLSEIKIMLKQLGVGVINIKAEVERLKSLELCFEYSFRALAKMHQYLFPRLTLFNSPFPASAVEAIFGYDKIDVLLDLYDYSLLRRIEFDSSGLPETNYRLYHFHPVVRQYAQQKANEYGLKLEEEYGDKFSKYYYRTVYETYNSPNKENRNSKRKCFDVIFEGENNDIIRSSALARNPRLAAYILRIAGIILTEVLKFNSAFTLYQKALAIDQKYNEEVSVAKDYENMSAILWFHGKFEEALAYKNKSLEIYRKFGIKSRMVIILNGIAITLRDMGKLNDSLIYHVEALDHSREIPNKVFSATTYNSMGFTLRMTGEVEKDSRRFNDSLTCHNNALNIYRQLGKDKYLDSIAIAYMGLGLTYRSIAEMEKDSSKLSEAQQYLEESLAIQLQLKNQDRLARLYNNLGLVLYTAGQLENDLTKLNRSIIFYSKALDIQIAYDDKVGLIRSYNNIAVALHTSAQIEKDITKLEKAEDYRKKALDTQTRI